MNRFKSIGFLLFFICLNSILLAQELDSIFQLSLKELMNVNIISSTKKEESINTSPSVIFAITEREIEEKGYQTLLDLLKDQSGWDFDLSHGGWVGQVAYLRGTRSNTIPLMIDGILQNNINEGEMHVYHTITLENVKQVEIITGPASALYGPNALVGIINIITKKPEEINGVSASACYESSIGDEILAFNKYNFDLAAGKKFESGFGISGNIHFIKSNDEGKDYYDPDNIYKKDHVHYGELVPDDGFDNHQNDFVTSIRLTKDNSYTLGLDYSDIDEGIGSFLDGGNYMTNSDSVDFRWHTRRLSTFSKFDFKVSDDFNISPILYYRKDQVVNNSGYAFNYDWASISVSRGTLRYNRQYLFRYGLDLMLDYKISDKLSCIGGLVLEESQTSNESRRFGVQLNANNNIINPEEEIITDYIEIDTSGGFPDTIYHFTDTIYYENLIRVSKHKVNAFLAYHLKQKISFGVGMKYVGKRNASPINLKYGDNDGFYLPYTYSGDIPDEDQITYNGNGYMPGYTIFNTHVNINDFGYFTRKLHGLSASFSITNILNTDYLETPRSESRVSPPYHPQPGRRFALKIGYRF